MGVTWSKGKRRRLCRVASVEEAEARGGGDGMSGVGGIGKKFIELLRMK